MKEQAMLIKLVSINLSQNKKIAISNILFFLINFSFFLNPYVNNSGDFFTTSNYLILVGWFFTFGWTICSAYMIHSQLNLKLLYETKLSKEKIYLISTVALILNFLLIHILLLTLFNLYYSILFGFSMAMLNHITILYINYFFISFFIALILGLIYLNTKKKFTFTIIILLFFILVAGTVFYVNSSLNLASLIKMVFINIDYYNPFTGIRNYDFILYFKLIIITFLIIVLKFQITKIRWKTKAVTISLCALVLVLTVLFVYKENFEASKTVFFTDSYVDEYEKNKERKVIIKNTNYNIDSYNINILEERQPFFIVDLSLKNIKTKKLIFFLNESFRISEVMVNEEKIAHEQEGNKVGITLDSTNNQTITFKYSSQGTALNPINKKYMFLPYFYNWLPQQNDVQDYFVRNETSVEFNPQNKECKGIKKIESNISNLFIRTSNDSKCLSVMKGDYVQKEVTGKTIQLPKVWSGNTGDLKKYTALGEKILLDFNEIFLEDRTFNYNSLLIVPKFEVNAQHGFNDIWLEDGLQIILVDPFLNISSTSLFEHLNRNSPFSISYMLLREENNGENEKEIELLSLLFAVYFIEKNNIPVNDTNLDYYNSIYNKKELVEFYDLGLEQKKKRLLEIFDSL